LVRVFDLFEIRAWTDEETRDFFETAFTNSNVAIDIDDEALDMLAQFAGGLPVLAHEIGDAVFKTDEDNHIDSIDAARGIDIAADIVGRKHLEPQVFRAIRSERYRSILKKIGKDFFEFNFKRGEVLSHLSKSEIKVFDNFLGRMTDLGAIVRESEKGPGYYRFSNLLHYLYFAIWSGDINKSS